MSSIPQHLHLLPSDYFRECKLIDSYHSLDMFVLLFQERNIYTIICNQQDSVFTHDYDVARQVFHYCTRLIKSNTKATVLKD